MMWYSQKYIDNVAKQLQVAVNMSVFLNMYVVMCIVCFVFICAAYFIV